MQISTNSQIQMQAYNKTQQLKPAAEQTASPKTLQSDTVNISQEGMEAVMGTQRQASILPGAPKPK